MTESPRRALVLMGSMSMVILAVIAVVEVVRLAILGLDPIDSALPAIGVHLLGVSGWFMPVVSGSILTAYVALVPLTRSGPSVDPHAAVAVKVLPLICIATAVAAVTWCVVGAFGLFIDPSEAATLMGCVVLTALAVAFASLAGAALPRDVRRILARQRTERHVIAEQLAAMGDRPRLGLAGAVSVLIVWALLAFAVPLATYLAVGGMEAIGTRTARLAVAVIAVMALFLQLATFASFVARAPYVVRAFELTIAVFFFAAGIGIYVLGALVFAGAIPAGSSAPSAPTGPEQALSAAFAVVAAVVGTVTIPGVSTNVRWFRWWTPDSAIEALNRRTLVSQASDLDTRILTLEREIAAQQPVRRPRLWERLRRAF